MENPNKIATEKIAEFLKIIMAEKNLNANKIFEKSIKSDIKLSKQQIYSVLYMENNDSINTIDTLLNLMRRIDGHMELRYLAKRNNFDLMGEEKISEN